MTDMSDTHAENPAQYADSQAAALGLLSAAVFEWRNNRFSWRDDRVAASVFCGRIDDLPQSLKGLLAHVEEDGVKHRKDALSHLTWNGAQYKVRYKIRRLDGQSAWVEERGRRLSGEGRTPDAIIGVIRDVTSEHMAQRAAAYTASFDDLTGIWNASRFSEGLGYMIAFARRYQRPAALVALRISNLNDINMAYGYEAGDRLIRGVSQRLKSRIRLPDFCARMSGSAFILSLSDCSAQDMSLTAERLRAELTHRPYPSPHGDLYAEFSVGLVAINDGGVANDDLTVRDYLDRIETAIASSQERQGVAVVYDNAAPMAIAARSKRKGFDESDILTALNERRITLAYQPIVHASTRKPHHYECLLRLCRDDGEIVSAGNFIMAAEKLGLVHLLDRRALELASETLRDVPDVILALNISAQTVKNDAEVEQYISALKALGPNSRRVIVELTETVALEDPARASQFSHQARALGATFAIDDFGAGFTTFQNLMAIEAEEIKIDGSFIREISMTPHKQTFVRMMVDLAQTFSVKTVAEFVTTPEDADLLTRLGVDYLQGYMFGVPSTSPDWPLTPKKGEAAGKLSVAKSARL